MQKLSLTLDDLRVESFELLPDAGARERTVLAFGKEKDADAHSVPATCTPTCPETCQRTFLPNPCAC